MCHCDNQSVEDVVGGSRLWSGQLLCRFVAHLAEDGLMHS